MISVSIQTNCTIQLIFAGIIANIPIVFETFLNQQGTGNLIWEKESETLTK